MVSAHHLVLPTRLDSSNLDISTSSLTKFDGNDETVEAAVTLPMAVSDHVHAPTVAYS